MNVFEFVATTFSAATVLVLFIYILRKLFIAWIMKQSSIEIETHKAELQNLSDYLKHNLQQEVFKSEMHLTSLNIIYPEIYTFIKRSQSKLAFFFESVYSPDLEGMTIEKFEEILIENELSFTKKALLLKKFEKDKTSCLWILNESIKEKDLEKLKSHNIDLMNLVITKEIYISDAALDLCKKIYEKLRLCQLYVEKELENKDKNWEQAMKNELHLANAKIEEFRILIKNELQPRNSIIKY